MFGRTGFWRTMADGGVNGGENEVRGGFSGGFGDRGGFALFESVGRVLFEELFEESGDWAATGVGLSGLGAWS
ncbi:hypothetical protein [Tunturibacter empetritectus]|uniref:Uncharacterized protein n=1 Tax=Tunturiibacter lichenicola TaxID=2051959 RepID=A0A7W8N4L9_9BACT|nr:hypothetical protein [Edaphobacter lichenicola]MBB5345334.1 hypothetical protein [Edaphobacter lichenicola]